MSQRLRSSRFSALSLANGVLTLSKSGDGEFLERVGLSFPPPVGVPGVINARPFNLARASVGNDVGIEADTCYCLGYNSDGFGNPADAAEHCVALRHEVYFRPGLDFGGLAVPVHETHIQVTPAAGDSFSGSGWSGAFRRKFSSVCERKVYGGSNRSGLKINTSLDCTFFSLIDPNRNNATAQLLKTDATLLTMQLFEGMKIQTEKAAFDTYDVIKLKNAAGSNYIRAISIDAGDRVYIGGMFAGGLDAAVLALGGAATKLRFFPASGAEVSTNAVGKQTVTGSRGGNAAIASLAAALAAYGLIVDSTSA
ncbi:hypothetical protein RAS1_42270 [Phycisphaerae bacterium RAS1]|nr:hypothetical protein RAS1_42270 [Phycisphaerae bacterium RAS1]